MDPKERYLKLGEKLEELTQRRAQTEARLALQREERDRLLGELRERGVNTDELEQEKARIEEEIRAETEKAEKLVADFERDLEEATGARQPTKDPPSETDDPTDIELI